MGSNVNLDNKPCLRPIDALTKMLNTFYPNIQFIAANGDGVHLKSVFGIVSQISQRPLGTMRKSSRSKDGKYFHAIPTEYIMSIGVQGSMSSDAYSIAEELQFLFNTLKYKAWLREEGYSSKVYFNDIASVPMKMDTGWFTRHTFQISLSADVVMFVEEDVIEGVIANSECTGDIHIGKTEVDIP